MKKINLEYKLFDSMTNGSVMKDAIYQHASLPEHRGNPLIEALPPFLLAQNMIKEFRVYPRYSKEERALPVAERLMSVMRLNCYLEPLPCHLDLIDQINITIRSGYQHRNLDSAEYNKKQNEFYRRAMEGYPCPISPLTPSTAPSFALLGTSGVGKTFTVERTLCFLPQALFHEKYRDAQVVWIKIECPPGGSLKQLLITILLKFDFLLDTRYCDLITERTTVDAFLILVANTMVRHHLGVLVIDEIQNVLTASNVGQEQMLNALVAFVNVSRIPLITIGTPKALSLLHGTFREARRISDHGAYMWDRLSSGKIYSYFLNSLWKYQWTSHPTDLEDKIMSTFHDRTEGIHALNVRLYQFGQLQAIKDNCALTSDLINDVADEKFQLIQPMLHALKSKKRKLIEQYEDLYHEGLKKLDNELAFESSIALLKSAARKKNSFAKERVRTTSHLLAEGHKGDLVQKVVNDYFKLHPDATCYDAVTSIRNSLRLSKKPEDAPKDKNLIEIVNAGKKRGHSPIESLEVENIVTPVCE